MHSVSAVVVDGPAPDPHTVGALTGGHVDVLGRTADTDEAVRLVGELAPTLVVADRAGPEVIEVMAACTPQVPVLALVADADQALAAVRAGATSLLVAPDPLGELAAAARRTAAGEAVFSPGLADVVLAAFGAPPAGGARLTDRESDVLALIVEGLTARQIATRLGLSPRTVENHVQNILRKLGLRSRAALVRYAIENGLA